MINLLILFVLTKRELTMYKISKYIKDYFGAYIYPSFGSIKPALKLLEQKGHINIRKSISDGGKQFCYYSINSNGQELLKEEILKPISENPVQFFANANIKISCASILDKKEVADLLFNIKSIAMEHKFQAEKILNDEYTPNTFYGRVVLDNTVKQYENFIDFVESLEKENGNN